MADSVIPALLSTALSMLLVSTSRNLNNTLTFGNIMDIECSLDQTLDCNWLHNGSSVQVGSRRYQYGCTTGSEANYCAVFPIQVFEVLGDGHWQCWCIPKSKSESTPPEFRSEERTSVQECGHANELNLAEPKIAGGENTFRSKYPWIVGIHNKSKDLLYPLYESLFCHGSLISKKWIITSAHCVFLNKTLRTLRHPNQLFVSLGGYFLGENIFDTNVMIRDLCEIRIHPKNKRFTYDYDVALLKLATEVRLSNQVGPICLPPPRLNVSGQNVTAAGWGATIETFKSPWLKEITIPVISNPDCERLLNLQTIKITPRMLCAGDLEGYKDTCSGDSGSGLFHKYENNRFVLVGIVSFGLPGCAQPNSPGVYARVSEFLPFISTHIDDESCPDQ